MSKKNVRSASANYHDLSSHMKMFVSAKNDEQKNMMQTIANNTITFVKGYAGTGKTFLAVTYAIQQLAKKKYEKITFTRPVVEAGERLGYLPGDMFDKIDPYMIPIFDSLRQLLPGEVINKLMAKNGHDAALQVLPLAYMRGVSFRNALIICDEMQNATPEQVRMVLSRIGEGSKMILCGDIKQSDLHKSSGLSDAYDLLQGIEGVGFVSLSERAIIRHPIIRHIENRYEERFLANKTN